MAFTEFLLILAALIMTTVIIPELKIENPRKLIQLAIISISGNPLVEPAELSKCGKGGQNHYVREIGIQLSRSGYNVTWFTRSETPKDQGVVTLSTTLRIQYVIVGPQEHLFRDLVYEYLDNVTSQIDVAQFDVVFTNYWMSGYVGMQLGLPQIHVHHSLGVQKFQWEHITDIGRIRLDVERRINKNVDCVVHQLRNEQQLTNATHATLITPGIEVEKFTTLSKEDAKEKLGFSENATNVLFVGRFVPQKGIGFALEALNKTRLPIRFRLIGAYKGRPLEYLVMQYPQFNFLGAKPLEEVVEYMAASDILVVPSLYEPFGLVIIEGMAAGCCLLVSAVGGPDEQVVEGVNGLKVPPGDAEGILRAFERLASNKTWMKEIGELNRKVGLERYSWTKTAREFDEAIIEIIKKKEEKYDSGIILNALIGLISQK